MSTIQLQRITKRFFRGTPNEVVALDAIDLQVDTGDFVTLIGSNGAGKSTILRVISGEVRADAGKVLLGNEDISRTPEHQRARLIGRIAQDPLGSTASEMSIEENLAMAAMRGKRRLLGMAVTARKRSTFRDLVEELQLGLEQRLSVQVGTLSGGQRQALALVMATLGDPLVLLLDEHTAALDPKTARQVMEITNRIVSRRSLTTLMVTHNMEQAIQWGNRLIMMSAGRIVLDIRGTEKQLLTVPALIQRFHQRSGETFADDRALLVEEVIA